MLIIEKIEVIVVVWFSALLISLGSFGELKGWHELRKAVFPFRSLETWRRRFKIVICYPIAFWFGGAEALRWSSPLHELFLWRVRLLWRKLWVRGDEFHSSLDMDIVAMYNMTESEREVYGRDLVKRRIIAHERDLSR
ncbi:MAG: hypothetical protein AAB628_00430 [Patescibacteria group bacterium]